jgi:predicted membrane protein
MTKREIVWLIVKLIGVYFLYEAAASALGLIGTIFTLISVAGRYLGADDKFNFFKVIAWAIAMTFLYGWIGWYLINDGRLLFALLNREEPPPVLKDFKKEPIDFSDTQN